MPDDEPHVSRRYTTMVVAALAIVALTCVAFLIPVPYVTLKPGPIFNTLGEFNDEPIISFEGEVETYPTSGSLDFTTVSVTRADAEVPLAGAVMAFFDRENAVVPRSLIYPDGQSQGESTAESALQLSSSKDNSKAAALRAAGYDVSERPAVASVVEGSPSEGELESGDVIVAVDGQEVQEPTEVVELVGDRAPGDDVEITVLRDDEELSVTIASEAAPEDENVARIGIGIGPTYDFPIAIDNNVGDEIGGPSAGSMFALAIYDMLTPGELTDGERIAGTGSITGDGQVGAIGGVRQKMAGAAADQTSVFLVPDGNCAEAAEGDDYGMTLVRVETLDDAIDSLEALSAGDDTEVSTCS